MALSEEEQRLLDEMERNLYKNDVDYVATNGVPRALDYRRLVIGLLIAVVGIVGLFLAIFFQQLLIGVAGFAVMFFGVVFALSGGKPDPKQGAGTQANRRSHTPSSQSETWEQRANRRWDERNQR
ncbi:MAG: DUF3040 domain-containing protein [Microbacteriaceae bacterium]